MGYSTIESLNLKEICCYYCVLVAQSASGKTKAQAIWHDSIELVEKYYNVGIQESNQANAATVESLLLLLERIPSLVGMYICMLINIFQSIILIIIILLYIKHFFVREKNKRLKNWKYSILVIILCTHFFSFSPNPLVNVEYGPLHKFAVQYAKLKVTKA